eukprot:scaffold9008_cov56-Cyclotella_meneghiniana.AAC.7
MVYRSVGTISNEIWQCYVSIYRKDVPGYIEKVLLLFSHKKTDKQQHCPFQPNPRKFGKDSQVPLPPDESKRLDLKGVRRVQQIVGALLFYAQVIDNIILPALSTEHHCQLSSNCYRTNAQIMRTTSGLLRHTSYGDGPLPCLGHATRARSQVAGYYFLGSEPTDDTPIKLNGAILVLEGKIQRLILEELGHKNPATPIYCDNATATGIANVTVKNQRSRSMEMGLFWVQQTTAKCTP